MAQKKQSKGKGTDDSSKKKPAKKTTEPQKAAPESMTRDSILDSKETTKTTTKTAEPAKAAETPSGEVNPQYLKDYASLFEAVEAKYHPYLVTIIENPIRNFQGSTLEEFIALIAEQGLPVAVAKGVDSRDYTKGNTWEQAQMNIMNALLPPPKMLAELLKQGIAKGNTQAVKWFPEACGNPRELIEILQPVLKDKNANNRWWAAVHLSRHAPDSEGLVEVLSEALKTHWVANRLDNSTSGMTGRGEAAKALARLGAKAQSTRDALFAELSSETVEPADAAEIAGALNQITGEIDEIMKKLTDVAERMLAARRGTTLHGGDRELLRTLRHLISRWKEKGKETEGALAERVAVLEKEIQYHLSV
jgi:hypothetical protein